LEGPSVCGKKGALIYFTFGVSAVGAVLGMEFIFIFIFLYE
jgi:hypothetical protein